MLALAENTALMGGQRVSPQLKCFKMLLNSAGGVSFFFLLTPHQRMEIQIFLQKADIGLCVGILDLFSIQTVFLLGN